MKQRILFFVVIIAAFAHCLLPAMCFGQTVGQFAVPKWTSGGLSYKWLTPVNGRFFGIDGSGNPAMLSGGGGSGLDNIASTITGDTLTFGGTLTAGRAVTWRDLAGTVALTSDLSSYLTTSTAASTYAPLESPTFTGTVTIPEGANIGGYAPLNMPTFTGAAAFEGGVRFDQGLTFQHGNTGLGPQESTLSVAEELAAMTWTMPSASGQLLADSSAVAQSQVTGLNTTDRASFANVKAAHSTLTYAGTTDINMDGDGFQTVTLTGNVTFTTSNRAAGRSRTVRIVGDSSLRTLTFPSWTFVGAAAPASLAANKDAILTITAFGTADTDVVAAYAVEP